MNKGENQEAGVGVLCAVEDEDRTKGPWSFEENLFYVSFLEKNRAIMSSKKRRRQFRIFDRMSAFIRSRNPLQCRSHHQKLLEKMGDFKVIIKNFKKNVGKKYFKQQYRRCISELPAELACPSIKEEQESLQTERISPLPPHTSSPQQISQNAAFSFTGYVYYPEMGQQMMGGLLMMPYYFSA